MSQAEEANMPRPSSQKRSVLPVQTPLADAMSNYEKTQRTLLEEFNDSAWEKLLKDNNSTLIQQIASGALSFVNLFWPKHKNSEQPALTPAVTKNSLQDQTLQTFEEESAILFNSYVTEAKAAIAKKNGWVLGIGANSDAYKATQETLSHEASKVKHSIERLPWHVPVPYQLYVISTLASSVVSTSSNDVTSDKLEEFVALAANKDISVAIKALNDAKKQVPTNKLTLATLSGEVDAYVAKVETAYKQLEKLPEIFATQVQDIEDARAKRFWLFKFFTRSSDEKKIARLTQAKTVAEKLQKDSEKIFTATTNFRQQYSHLRDISAKINLIKKGQVKLLENAQNIPAADVVELNEALKFLLNITDAHLKAEALKEIELVDDQSFKKLLEEQVKKTLVSFKVQAQSGQEVSAVEALSFNNRLSVLSHLADGSVSIKTIYDEIEKFISASSTNINPQAVVVLLKAIDSSVFTAAQRNVLSRQVEIYRAWAWFNSNANALALRDPTQATKELFTAEFTTEFKKYLPLLVASDAPSAMHAVARVILTNCQSLMNTALVQIQSADLIEGDLLLYSNLFSCFAVGLFLEGQSIERLNEMRQALLGEVEKQILIRAEDPDKLEIYLKRLELIWSDSTDNDRLKEVIRKIRLKAAFIGKHRQDYEKFKSVVDYISGRKGTFGAILVALNRLLFGETTPDFSLDKKDQLLEQLTDYVSQFMALANEHFANDKEVLSQWVYEIIGSDLDSIFKQFQNALESLENANVANNAEYKSQKISEKVHELDYLFLQYEAIVRLASRLEITGADNEDSSAKEKLSELRGKVAVLKAKFVKVAEESPAFVYALEDADGARLKSIQGGLQAEPNLRVKFKTVTVGDKQFQLPFSETDLIGKDSGELSRVAIRAMTQENLKRALADICDRSEVNQPVSQQQLDLLLSQIGFVVQDLQEQIAYERSLHTALGKEVIEAIQEQSLCVAAKAQRDFDSQVYKTTKITPPVGVSIGESETRRKSARAIIAQKILATESDANSALTRLANERQLLSMQPKSNQIEGMLQKNKRELEQWRSISDSIDTLKSSPSSLEDAIRKLNGDALAYLDKVTRERLLAMDRSKQETIAKLDDEIKRLKMPLGDLISAKVTELRALNPLDHEGRERINKLYDDKITKLNAELDSQIADLESSKNDTREQWAKARPGYYANLAPLSYLHDMVTLSDDANNTAKMAETALLKFLQLPDSDRNGLVTGLIRELNHNVTAQYPEEFSDFLDMLRYRFADRLKQLPMVKSESFAQNPELLAKLMRNPDFVTLLTLTSGQDNSLTVLAKASGNKVALPKDIKSNISANASRYQIVIERQELAAVPASAAAPVTGSRGLPGRRPAQMVDDLIDKEKDSHAATDTRVRSGYGYRVRTGCG